mmetsp:Transcript_159169/g.296682  ORF Transcript_159169/g.296682 Transcript_159169/m.296682 type:complete len:234 (-) Transcript_159169:417-1118(-)
MRVLVIQGSMSGQSEQVAKKLHKAWSGERDIKFTLAPKVLEGNEAGEQFSTLNNNFDVLLVITSSYGCGDPPDNFVIFLRELIKASEASKKPLAGLQHAVMGFGDSSYETYQNCPRLTDKLLEECGSRRLHKRHEIDTGAWEDGMVEKMAEREKAWQDSVFKTLQSNPSKGEPPACKWAEEGIDDTIYPKSVDDLAGLAGGSGSNGAGSIAMIAGLGVLAGALYLGRDYIMGA